MKMAVQKSAVNSPVHTTISCQKYHQKHKHNDHNDYDHETTMWHEGRDEYEMLPNVQSTRLSALTIPVKQHVQKMEEILYQTTTIVVMQENHVHRQIVHDNKVDVKMDCSVV